MPYNFVRSEWVTIKEFPKYEINALGIIRKRDNQVQVSTIVSHIETVKLPKDGKRYLRSVRKLTRIAFPEFD